jgi:hypothetical protein
MRTFFVLVEPGGEEHARVGAAQGRHRALKDGRHSLQPVCWRVGVLVCVGVCVVCVCVGQKRVGRRAPHVS